MILYSIIIKLRQHLPSKISNHYITATIDCNPFFIFHSDFFIWMNIQSAKEIRWFAPWSQDFECKFLPGNTCLRTFLYIVLVIYSRFLFCCFSFSNLYSVKSSLKKLNRFLFTFVQKVVFFALSCNCTENECIVQWQWHFFSSRKSNL